ncbi:MAG: taurine catabolism dioxygenase TauD [Alphaproteobacteria bacterium]|nr:taurine catabolism dioxygenase TauD [Alphaproteobacteria bacterium]|tara:strand:- start:259 stop:1101 length:843 start_codon:yes stop_codon:yes gene_type:complete
MTVTVTPLGQSFGVEIGNVDLTVPLDEATFAHIKRVLIEKQVAVISDVPTDIKVLVDFGRRFGTFRPHILSQYHHPDAHEVAVISNDPATGLSRTTSRPAGSFWHADLTYERNPCDVSFLYSVEVPGEGGDTRFADMIGAYETLPTALKEKIEDLTSIHRYGGRAPDTSIVGLSEDQKAAHPDVEHPVVRRIPETGCKSLYVSPAYTVQIVGYDERESDTLLEELFGYALTPELEYRHKWRDRQIVFFDNRTTMHSATPDYPPDVMRTLYRMFVAFEDAA